MRNTLGCLNIRSTIWHHKIISRHIHRRLSIKPWVKVDFLKRITRQPQSPQHLLVLRSVLNHHIGKLVVHICLHTTGRLFFLFSFFANNLGTHRTLRWKCLHDGLSLKLHYSFSQQGVVHTTRSGPRLCAILNLKS